MCCPKCHGIVYDGRTCQICGLSMADATSEEIQEIIVWWRLRKVSLMTSAQRYRRTYYVAQHWSEAIHAEAEKTGDTQGDVLERALSMYFYGRGDRP